MKRPYPSRDRALRQLDRHGRTLTAVPLSELSNEDLITLATSRFGGPSPEEFAEAGRRIHAAAVTVGAALDKIRLRRLVAAS